MPQVIGGFIGEKIRRVWSARSIAALRRNVDGIARGQDPDARSSSVIDVCRSLLVRSPRESRTIE
jgi:hypothetical protein